jgi:hypothetical protein
MENVSIYKTAIIFGVGFGIFWLLKPKDATATVQSASATPTTSFDATDKPITLKQKEDANIVLHAYQSAVLAGEPPMILSELNRECMKDYGLKCYQKKDGSFTVTDASGREIAKV